MLIALLPVTCVSQKLIREIRNRWRLLVSVGLTLQGIFLNFQEHFLCIYSTLVKRNILHSFITVDCFFTWKSTCDWYFVERTQITSGASTKRGTWNIQEYPNIPFFGCFFNRFLSFLFFSFLFIFIYFVIIRPVPDVPGCSEMFHVPGFVDALASGTTSRQQSATCTLFLNSVRLFLARSLDLQSASILVVFQHHDSRLLLLILGVAPHVELLLERQRDKQKQNKAQRRP